MRFMFGQAFAGAARRGSQRLKELEEKRTAAIDTVMGMTETEPLVQALNKIFKGTYETSKVIENEDLDKIKLDIEELKNRKTTSNDSVSSNERILNQIKVLSEMKKDGILTNSEFNDKKKLLLDKLK